MGILKAKTIKRIVIVIVIILVGFLLFQLYRSNSINLILKKEENPTAEKKNPTPENEKPTACQKEVVIKEVIKEVEVPCEEKSKIEPKVITKEFSFTDDLLNQKNSTEKVMAFLVMATGQYNQFIEKQVKSFDEYFKTKEGQDWMLVYFVSDLSIQVSHPNVLLIVQERLKWPYDTMNRNAVYMSHVKLIRTFDFLFCIDVDLLWIEPTTFDELLPDDQMGMVACEHPGRPGTFETRPTSAAFVPPNKRSTCLYYAGGMFGGDTTSVLHFFDTTLKLMEKDRKNNIVALWHDESYLNHIFCMLTPPKKAFHYTFIYPRDWKKEVYKTQYNRMFHDHTNIKYKMRESE